MKNYNNSKIYKIQKIGGTDNDLVYIGTTTYDLLSKAMASHVINYKRFINQKKCNNVGSKIIFNKYGVKNCEIVLIEAVNCNNVNELKATENKYHKIFKSVKTNSIYEKENNYNEEILNEDILEKYKRQHLLVLENNKQKN